MKAISKIILTMGDPGGIGPEIILKALQKLSGNECEKCAWIVIGHAPAFEAADADLFKQLFPSIATSLESLNRPGFYFYDITDAASSYIKSEASSGTKLKFVRAEIDPANVSLAFAALEEAVRLTLAGQAHGLVTAPLNKTSMRLIENSFIGHTEFLAARSGCEKFAMAFMSEKLKITLATIHVPLKQVSTVLTKEGIYDKIMLTHAALKNYYAQENPSIAVCALNPHGRETGTEEDEVILPAIEAAQSNGVNVSGPYSADQLFYEAYQEQRYDALIAMYHDQALGPFKMVAFHEGVNVTLGLPFIRTSPDHGTAFDIAYQDKADPRSMLAAMRLAAEYADNAQSRT